MALFSCLGRSFMRCCNCVITCASQGRCSKTENALGRNAALLFQELHGLVDDLI